MNIYEIGQDFDNYKFFVFKEDDELNAGAWNCKGQSLVNEWKGFSLELFRDKKKKKDKRSEDFDASCYFSGCLIVNKRTSLLLSEKLKGQIEVLPVNVDGNISITTSRPPCFNASVAAYSISFSASISRLTSMRNA